MSKKHAKFSASGSERWLACPGSIQLSEKAPAPVSSSYAEEGTLAHSCLEALLRAPIPKTKAAFAKLEKEHGKEMAEHAVSAAVEIFARVNRRGLKSDALLIESKVDLSFIEPDMFGTLDAAIVEEYGTLEVIDFKYGAGVAVEPEENSQLIYYALGIAHLYDFNFKEVVLTIIQPRAFHAAGPTRSWTMPIDLLKIWQGRFRFGVEKCKESDAHLNPGDHCRFCPAATICPAISTKALATARVEFDDVTSEITTPAHKSLEPKRLGQILEAMDRLEMWIDSTRKYAFDQASAGHKIPGWKLVPKRSTRKWLNEEKVTKEARKLFGDKAFSVPELLSPAQLEKVAKKDWVNERVTSISSGTTLVPDSDKRDEVNKIESDFDVIPELVSKSPKNVKPITKEKSNGRKNGH